MLESPLKSLLGRISLHFPALLHVFLFFSRSTAYRQEAWD